jgi:hypothetical protein
MIYGEIKELMFKALQQITLEFKKIPFLFTAVREMNFTGLF